MPLPTGVLRFSAGAGFAGAACPPAIFLRLGVLRVEAVKFCVCVCSRRGQTFGRHKDCIAVEHAFDLLAQRIDPVFTVFFAFNRTVRLVVFTLKKLKRFEAAQVVAAKIKGLKKQRYGALAGSNFASTPGNKVGQFGGFYERAVQEVVAHGQQAKVAVLQRLRDALLPLVAGQQLGVVLPWLEGIFFGQCKALAQFIEQGCCGRVVGMGVTEKPFHQGLAAALLSQADHALSAGTLGLYVGNERTRALNLGQRSQLRRSADHGRTFKLQHTFGCAKLLRAKLNQSQIKVVV